MARETIKAQILTDAIHRAISVDSVHDKIHKGEMFRASGSFTLGTSGVHRLLFRTGDVSAHIYGEVVSTGAGTFNFYEEPTVSATGSAVTVYNKNRNSSNTPESICYDSPTVTGNGTLLDPFLVGTDKKAGGDGRNENERVLEPNTDYLLVATSSTADNDFVVKVDWYEQNI